MLRQAKINAKIKPLEKDLKDIKDNQEQAIAKFKTNAEQLLVDYNTEVANLQEEIDKLIKEKEELKTTIKQNQSNRYNDFVEFRTTHYNEKMEMLLQKLGFNFLKAMDRVFEKQNGELDEYATQTGTVKDYIKYIKSKMKLQ